MPNSKEPQYLNIFHATLRAVAPALLVLLVSVACNDSTSSPPRIYDHGQNKKIADPLSNQPRPLPTPAAPYSITDRLAESGGEIQVSLSIFSPNAEPESGPGIVRATYEATMDDAHVGSVQTWNFSGVLGVPLVVLVSERPLSMSSLEIQNPDGLLLRAFSDAELKPLRLKARKGVGLSLILNSDGRTVRSERIVRNPVPPLAASPDTDYVALPSTGELSLDQLRDVATATTQYHLDLLKRLNSDEHLDSQHLSDLADAAYYTSTARDRMAQAAASLTARIDVGSQALREAILRNLRTADSLGPILNQIIEEGIARASDLDPNRGLELLMRLFPTEHAAEAIENYERRFAPLDGWLRSQLLYLAKLKAQPDLVTQLGMQIFKEDSDASSNALLVLVANLQKSSKLDTFLSEAAPLLRSVKFEEIKALLGSLLSEAEIARTGSLLIEKLPELTGAQLADISRTLAIGWGRDAVLLAMISKLKSVTTLEIRAILAKTYAPMATRAAAQKLFAKVPAFDASALLDILAGVYRGPQRDLILADGLTALPGTKPLTSSRALEAMKTTFDTTGQIGVYEASLPRIIDLTVANGLGLTSIIAASGRDRCLLRLVDIVIDLSVEKLGLIASRAVSSASRDEILKRGGARLRL